MYENGCWILMYEITFNNHKPAASSVTPKMLFFVFLPLAYLGTFLGKILYLLLYRWSLSLTMKPSNLCIAPDQPLVPLEVYSEESVSSSAGTDAH